MAKLSNKIDLSKAVKNADVIVDTSGSVTESSPVDSLLNSGVKAHKERKKKEKNQSSLEEKATEENSLFAELIPKEEKPDGKQEEKWPKSYEETCEYEIRHAHEAGLPEPDFDFRQTYTKGQRMWFVRILSALGEKEVIEVVLNTIYPRMIVAVQPKAFCHCIGYNMRDQLFYNPKDAAQYCDSIEVTPKYKLERPTRRKGNDDYEEDDDMPSSQESLEELMHEMED